jgi:amino acid permease
LAPSLGDVLDLVGCAAGTMIAFVLPGLFSFRLQGYTHLAAVILAVGGIVGLIGTVFSLQKLITDM